MKFNKKVFKSGITKPDVKFTGVWIARPDFNFLSLYCLSKGYSKSILLKNIILDWKSSIKEKESELIDQVAVIVQKQWKIQKALNKAQLKMSEDEQFMMFLREVRLELKKYISDPYIDRIVSRIIL